jgi:hypothetical protein
MSFVINCNLPKSKRMFLQSFPCLLSNRTSFSGSVCVPLSHRLHYKQRQENVKLSIEIRFTIFEDDSEEVKQSHNTSMEAEGGGERLYSSYSFTTSVLDAVSGQHHAPCTVSDYGLDDRAIEVRSPAEAKDIFLYPLCPDRLWGPPSLLYNGYLGVLSPGVKRHRGVTLTTHPHLVPRL